MLSSVSASSRFARFLDSLRFGWLGRRRKPLVRARRIERLARPYQKPSIFVSGGASGFVAAPRATKRPKTWLAAAGQIFFTLSVGMGSLQAYASYLGPKDDIALSGIAVLNGQVMVAAIRQALDEGEDQAGLLLLREADVDVGVA